MGASNVENKLVLIFSRIEVRMGTSNMEKLAAAFDVGAIRERERNIETERQGGGRGREGGGEAVAKI